MDVQGWICEWIESHASEFGRLSQAIWSYAEPSGQEKKSSGLLKEILNKYSFTVQSDLAGMQTAFSARYGCDGPVIGLLGEYDALEGLSQKAAGAEPEIEADMSCGHGCGHNLLGVGSLFAAIAVKEYLQQHQLPGSVVYYGCPAEEQGCGKMHMIEGGCFQELDAALTWHPMDRNEIDASASLASICVEFHFLGRAAHAARCPEQGRSALHAVELMNAAVNFMREHVTSDVRIHYAISNSGGNATNVIQSEASVIYEVRAPREEQIQKLLKRIIAAAEGAALMTETNMRFSYGDHYMNFIANDTINRVALEKFMMVGAPVFSENEIALANTLRNTYEKDEKNDMPFYTEIEAYQGLHGCQSVSTDVGNVSHLVPAIQIYTVCCAKGTPNHSWQMVSQAGSSIGRRGMETASKVLALTAIELIQNSEVLSKAKKEHDELKIQG